MQDWKFDGKPALVVIHMQEGIVGKGAFVPGWFDAARRSIDECGMIDHTKDLLKAFREKGLPVIFVNAIPNPIGVVPAYGYLFRKIEDAEIAKPLLESQKVQDGVRVMPEMERRPEEPVLYNWLQGAFTQSGLDIVLKRMGVTTVVLTGFALHSVIYATCVQAGDLWYSTIVASDCTTPAVLTGDTTEIDEEIDQLVSKVVLGTMMKAIALVTDSKDIIEHVKAY